MIGDPIRDFLTPDGGDDYLHLVAALFPARLTAVQKGTGTLAAQWLYSFTEVIRDPTTGLFRDADSPRTGTATVGPAQEINNRQVTVPAFAWMRLCGWYKGNQIYEFDAAAASYVSNVCPVLVYNGGILSVESIVVEYTNPDGSKVCITNPTGCCPGSGSGGESSDCCPGVTIPFHLCLRFLNGPACLTSLGAIAANDAGNWVGNWCGPGSQGLSLRCGVGGDGQPHWLLSGGEFPGEGDCFFLHVQDKVADSFQCGPPFTARFNAVPYGGACGSGTVDVLITAPPCAGGSGSGSGSAPACTIADTELGTTSACTPTTALTMSISVVAGETVVLAFAQLDSNVPPINVTMGGASMGIADSINDGIHTLTVYEATAAATGTVTISVDDNGVPFTGVMSAVGLTGLQGGGTPFEVTQNSGIATLPDLGSLATPTDLCGFVYGVFLLTTPSGAIVWGSPMASGGQDVTACAPYTLTEGFDIADANATVPIALSGITAAHWLGIGLVYV